MRLPQFAFPLEEGSAEQGSTHVIFNGEAGLQDLAQEVELDLPELYQHMATWVCHLTRKHSQTHSH